MPFPSKADNNVPFTPGRARYSIVNNTPTWCYHQMAAGQTLTGEAPQTATTGPNETDPVVKGGIAEYKNLTKGGLFTIQSKAKKPLVVEAVSKDAAVTLKVVDLANSYERDAPTCPFKVSASETLKASGGPAQAKVGILYRIDGEVIW